MKGIRGKRLFLYFVRSSTGKVLISNPVLCMSSCSCKNSNTLIHGEVTDGLTIAQQSYVQYLSRLSVKLVKGFLNSLCQPYKRWGTK